MTHSLTLQILTGAGQLPKLQHPLLHSVFTTADVSGGKEGTDQERIVVTAVNAQVIYQVAP